MRLEDEGVAWFLLSNLFKDIISVLLLLISQVNIWIQLKKDECIK